MDGSKTPRRKTPTTKPWNTNLGQLPLNESLVSDFEDEGKSRLCGVKLRSTRLDKWIVAHKDAFGESFERSKATSVTWKTTPGTSSVTVQTTTTTSQTGKVRGSMQQCYHQPCDNVTSITDDKLTFLAKVTDSVLQATMKLAEVYLDSCSKGGTSAAAGLDRSFITMMTSLATACILFI